MEKQCNSSQPVRLQATAAPLVALALTAIILCGGSCAGVRPVPPDVQLAALQVDRITLSHINFLAELSVFNPNPYPVSVEEIDYRLSLNDVEIFSGRRLTSVRLSSDSRETVTVPIAGSYLNIARLLTGEKEQSLTYDMSGHVRLKGKGIFPVTLPFSESGSLPLAEPLQHLRSPAR